MLLIDEVLWSFVFPVRFGRGHENQFQNGKALSTKHYRRHTGDRVPTLMPKNYSDFQCFHSEQKIRKTIKWEEFVYMVI